jgi:hypothetical protein
MKFPISLLAVLSMAIGFLVALPAASSAGATVSASISKLSSSGAIDAATASKARTAYNESRSLRKRTSGAKRTALTAQIRRVEAFARQNRITADRVMPLFFTLQNNVDWFKTNGPAAYGADRRFDKTGRIIFQYFPGTGWEFHPLSNFAKLNAVWTDKSSAARRALGAYAHELMAWGVNRGGALTWEYYFAFSGSKAPFISAISQGTAIQSLSRSGYALKDGTITEAAQRGAQAFGIAAPLGLKVERDEGFSYLGYSGSPRLIILNQFLQGLDGLHDYSIITDDQSAWSLYREGLKAARRETVLSDTGAWSLYNLDGPESPLNYHELVITFLTKLCDETTEAVFCDTRDRWQADLKIAPTITNISTKTKKGRIYVTFTLSKISTVRVTTAGGGTTVATVGYGKRVFSVAKGKSKTVKIVATDLAGNTGSASK